MLPLVFLLFFTPTHSANATTYTDDYPHENDTCLVQGNCGDYPCLHPDGIAPITVTADLQTLLKAYCPDYAEEQTVCCLKDQLESFKSSLETASAAIGSCPACMRDFQIIYCTWMCSNNQSTHLQVVANNTDAATRLRYFISPPFANKAYEACNEVRDSILGNLGIALICGTPVCPEELFYQKLGNNKYSPLIIDYIRNTDYIADNITSVPDDMLKDCGDTVDGKKCICRDCTKLCVEPPPPPPGKKVGYLVIGPIVGALVFVLLIIVIVILTFRHKPKVEQHVITVRENPLAVMNDGESGPVENGEKSEKSKSESKTESKTEKTEEFNQVQHPNKAGKLKFWLRIGPRLARRWSDICYDYYWIVLLGCVVVIAICCGGLAFFRVTTDPVDLWTAPSSESRKNKLYYDATFGKSYRAAQVIFKEKVQSGGKFTAGDFSANTIFNNNTLAEIFQVSRDIENLNSDNASLMYKNICYKPLGEYNKTNPINDCATQSIFQWLQNDPDMFATPEVYLEHFSTCSQANLLGKCLALYRGPAYTSTVLGGYDKEEFLQSKIVIISYTLDGSNANLDQSLIWEEKFKDYLLEEKNKHPNLEISFSSGRALEDEIERASGADIFTIVLSYILMFVYVAITLGSVGRTPSGCFMHSKASLGLGGVLIVLVSVICALGITSYAQLPSTLIVIEVVPFLVLAVGVDNVYIMVQALQRYSVKRMQDKPDKKVIKEILSDVMADTGPSMMLSSTCQLVAFALGSMSRMPSVQNFAYNATLALLANFLLQTSFFLILMRWDLTRQMGKRYDCLCCLKNDAHETPRTWNFIQDVWAKALFHSKWVCAFVLCLFGGFFIANIVMMPEIKLGLEATMALPTDSYLRDYYLNVYTEYRIGPGISFMFKPKDPSNGAYLDIFSEKIYSQLMGSEKSLLKTLDKYGKDEDEKYIEGSGSSFLKSFNESWMDTSVCCWDGVANTSLFCPSLANRTGCDQCTKTGLSTERKYELFQWFVSDIPGTDGVSCSDGGAVSYANAAVLAMKDNKAVGVTAGYFTSEHAPVSNSEQLIQSRLTALKICDEVNADNPDITVAPYSSFYHFYEQYDTIVEECAINITLCVVVTFFVALVLLGFDIYAALCILLTVAMCTIDMFGSMVYLGIPLNAVSLVNMLMSVGISVEFAAHIVQSFTISLHKTRLARAKDALVRIGPVIITGIFLTNFVGVVVLAAAKSELFIVFYFRMFFTINLLCVLHTVVFLPCFLAFLG